LCKYACDVDFGSPSVGTSCLHGQFDAKKPIKLRGTVAKVEFINPHSWTHIAVACFQFGANYIKKNLGRNKATTNSMPSFFTSGTGFATSCRLSDFFGLRLYEYAKSVG
jgi:hypothetical protein